MPQWAPAVACHDHTSWDRQLDPANRKPGAGAADGQPAGTHEREPAGAEREPAVAERESVVAEREPAVPERKPAVAGREPAVAERKPAEAEREPAVAEREPVVAERESAVADREPAVAERKPAEAEREPAAAGRLLTMLKRLKGLSKVYSQEGQVSRQRLPAGAAPVGVNLTRMGTHGEAPGQEHPPQSMQRQTAAASKGAVTSLDGGTEGG